MTLRTRSASSGLDRITILLLSAVFILAVLHHADHVTRVDHSGWPFRAKVTPFTFSLFAYPMILFALFGPRHLFWARWALLLIGATATVLAHVAVESPKMQYAMWAHNRSLDLHRFGFHNLAGVRSPAMGVLSVAIGMVLNVTAVVAVVAMFSQGCRLRRDSAAALQDRRS